MTEAVKDRLGAPAAATQRDNPTLRPAMSPHEVPDLPDFLRIPTAERKDAWIAHLTRRPE